MSVSLRAPVGLAGRPGDPGGPGAPDAPEAPVVLPGEDHGADGGWTAGALAALTVLAGALVALDVGVPVVRPVLAVALLVGLPTLVLRRRLALLGDAPAARWLYALGLTLLGLMLGAVLLNALLPLVGVDRPLQPAVLGVASTVGGLGLLRWRAERGLVGPVRPGELLRRAAAAPLEASQALAALSLLLAVLGAVRLNNEAGAGVALASLALAVAAVAALLLRRGATPGADLRCLLMVSLGLLLATSLRGWTITGHDVQSEFLVFRLTNEAQRWEMGAWQDAYNACLSLNVLPTVLAQASGLSGVVVFKVLLQVVFALVPLATLLLAGRFLPRRLALVAAVLPVALPTFYNDMPYLVRQEVAFLFLALVLLAATAPAPARRRGVLAGVLGVGVVVSHYSTTYLFLLGLGAGLAALGVWRLLDRWRRRRSAAPPPAREPLVLLHPLLVLFLALASWVWTGPVTHTGGHALDVVRGAVEAVVEGQERAASSDLSWALWSRDAPAPRERFDAFVGETVRVRQSAPPGLALFERLDRGLVRPPLVEPGLVEPTRLGAGVERIGLPAGAPVETLRLVGAGVVQVLLLVGLASLLLSLRGRRRSGAAPEEPVFVALGGVAALGLVVVVPSLSVEYGVLRAFEQTLLVTAPVCAWGLWVLARRLRRRRPWLLVGVPVALLAVFSGLVGAAFGGHAPRLALANAGLYHERYSAADSDVRAIEWVTEAAGRGDGSARIVANRNVGVRILARDPDAPVADRLYPTLLSTDDFLLVDSRLAETRRSAVFWTGDLISYRYPLRRVTRRLDLVYSASATRIYR